MKAIYEEVKTPFKYGIVIEPPTGKKVDCPTVFRHRGKWYMVYVQLEPAPLEGYTTQLAESENLLQWKPLGTILPRRGGKRVGPCQRGGRSRAVRCRVGRKPRPADARRPLLDVVPRRSGLRV